MWLPSDCFSSRFFCAYISLVLSLFPTLLPFWGNIFFLLSFVSQFSFLVLVLGERRVFETNFYVVVESFMVNQLQFMRKNWVRSRFDYNVLLGVLANQSAEIQLGQTTEMELS